MPTAPGHRYQFGRISAGERIQAYRGFLLAQRNDGRIFVKWQIKANPWLPRSFIWSGDAKGLEAYLEALINQDNETKEAIEHEGLASQHVYPPQEEIEAAGPMIEISPERLVAVMLGIDRLCIPAAGVLTIQHHGSRYWAGHVQALMIAKGILPAPTKAELQQALLMPKFPPKAHSGINLTMTPETSFDQRFGVQSAKEEPESKKGEEIRMLQRKHRYHSETVNLVAASPPYYVRRLHRGKDLIYLATSWSAKGPWDVLHKDEARCNLLQTQERVA
jgi:hypothetical protein